MPIRTPRPCELERLTQGHTADREEPGSEPDPLAQCPPLGPAIAPASAASPGGGGFQLKCKLPLLLEAFPSLAPNHSKLWTQPSLGHLCSTQAPVPTCTRQNAHLITTPPTTVQGTTLIPFSDGSLRLRTYSRLAEALRLGGPSEREAGPLDHRTWAAHS